jgi:hypothetical protein
MLYSKGFYCDFVSRETQDGDAQKGEDASEEETGSHESRTS